MAFKRALVVDDSRTARQSLARLLAQYDLEVAFAETGEEALDFLHHELVDVIFMDHTMPGMDGLEAVSAIKGNPRTAMIPVMMYTTKEGEVYVSQARALGAVGVLPKQVQPGVLYEMLDKLGLVNDGRADLPDAPPRRRLADLADEVDREYEQRAQSVSLQTQVTRILQEQHLKLRAEILASQRRTARQVAEEILAQRAADAPPPPSTLAASRAFAALSLVLVSALLTLGAFTWHVMAGRDAARLEVARLAAAARSELDALNRQNDRLAASVRSHDDQALARGRTGIEALAWSLNQSTLVAFDQQPFDDAAADRLAELLSWLEALEFRGRVQLIAELAPFCLTTDASGLAMLAEATLPMGACEMLGHPLQGADPTALQSSAFATALDAAANHPTIAVELAVRQPFESTAPMPSNVADAGAWNALAARLNRLHVALFPEGVPALTDMVSRR